MDGAHLLEITLKTIFNFTHSQSYLYLVCVCEHIHTPIHVIIKNTKKKTY